MFNKKPTLDLNMFKTLVEAISSRLDSHVLMAKLKDIRIEQLEAKVISLTSRVNDLETEYTSTLRQIAKDTDNHSEVLSDITQIIKDIAAKVNLAEGSPTLPTK